MAAHGHNLTVVSTDIDQSKPPGTHYILLENQYNEESREFVREMLAAKKEANSFQKVLSYFDDCVHICHGNNHWWILYFSYKQNDQF